MSEVPVRNEVILVNISNSESTELEVPLHQKFLSTESSSPQGLPLPLPSHLEGKPGGLFSGLLSVSYQGCGKCVSLLSHTAGQPPANTWAAPGFIKFWAPSASFHTKLCGHVPCFCCVTAQPKQCVFGATWQMSFYLVTTFVCLFCDSCWGLACVWTFQRANPASPSWPSFTRPCYLLQQVSGIPQQLVVACSWGFSPYLARYL